MPLGSLPTQISGTQSLVAAHDSDAIRNDPEWKGGNYVTQPQSLRTAQQMLFLVSSNPVLRQRQMPTQAESRRRDRCCRAEWHQDVRRERPALCDRSVAMTTIPGPLLEKIRAPLFAINSSDDSDQPAGAWNPGT